MQDRRRNVGWSTILLGTQWFWTLHDGERRGPYASESEAIAAAKRYLASQVTQ